MFGKTLIIAAAAFAAVAHGAACSADESNALLVKLTPIASNTNVAPCTADSGFNLIPPSGLPNDEQKTKMCKSDSCKALITAIKALNPTDCDFTILGVTLNVGSLVGTFDSDCTKLLAPATTTAAPSTPAATTAAPSTPGATTAPATTTATPDATKAQC